MYKCIVTLSIYRKVKQVKTMGQFSWIYSDTKKQLIDNKETDAYLLVPKPFQRLYGKVICENCYDGYGHFGNYDVYELILEWNKSMIPEIIRRIKNGTWHFSASQKDIINLQNFYKEQEITCETRWLGIILACHDKDNFALEYPIKITSKIMEYDDAEPSLVDSKQGWEEYDC